MQTIEVPDHLYPAIRNVVETLTRKGQDYADSDDEWTSNFVATSTHFGMPTWECADFNEVQKLARLAALRKRGRGPLNESVEDTYRDKACYAILAYALLLHHEVIAHPSGEETTVVLRESAPYIPPVFPPGGGGGSGGMPAPGPTHGGPHG